MTCAGHNGEQLLRHITYKGLWLKCTNILTYVYTIGLTSFVFLLILFIYLAYTRRFIISYNFFRLSQYFKSKCSCFYRGSTQLRTFEHFIYLAYDSDDYGFTFERIEEYLKKKFGCKIFNPVETNPNEHREMLGRAIETSQNIIIVLTQSFIDPVNRHGAELSEILEQHELGDVNVIVIA